MTALTVNYRAEHLFALQQNFAAYEFLLKQIAECDTEIEGLLTSLAARQPLPSAPLPTARRKRASKHQPQFDIRGPLHRLTGGTDLSQIDSIGPQAALHLIGEDRSEMLDLVPAQLRVKVVCRPRYGCRSCEGAVVQAPAPERPIDGGMRRRR